MKSVRKWTGIFIKKYAIKNRNKRVLLNLSLIDIRRFVFLAHPLHQPPVLTDEQKGFVTQLTALPLNSIMDNGEGEKSCKALGQKIFDQFKNAAGGDSFDGKKAVQDIYNTLVFDCTDGHLRKQYVERAWDGIGDDNWRWMA